VVAPEFHVWVQGSHASIRGTIL